MIKIAICDDEKYFVDTVEKMLKIYAEKNGKDFCIKKYTKPLQLMESLKEEFQIFFLDIEMPAMDGMELVDIIRRHDEKSIILYVSSHNEFLGVGYKYDVQNFITKPITQVQINCEMNRALRKLESYEQKYIAVKNEKGYFKLFLSDIEYIETVKRKVLFHLRNGNQEDGYFKMRDLEERLEKYYFVRCHNGIIVNVDCIESLHDLTTTLYSGAKIYITRSVPKNITIGTIDIVITDHMFPIITFLSLYRLSVHTAITIILSNNGMKIVITLMLDKCGGILSIIFFNVKHPAIITLSAITIITTWYIPGNSANTLFPLYGYRKILLSNCPNNEIDKKILPIKIQYFIFR